MEPKNERQEMASAARDRQRRFIGRPPDMPSEVTLKNVVDPRSALHTTFTEPGMWDFIGELLSDSLYPLRVTTLEQPPGCKAFEILVDCPHSSADLYIKFHWNNSKLVLRSFHPSTARERTGIPWIPLPQAEEWT